MEKSPFPLAPLPSLMTAWETGRHTSPLVRYVLTLRLSWKSLVAGHSRPGGRPAPPQTHPQSPPCASALGPPPFKAYLRTLIPFCSRRERNCGLHSLYGPLEASRSTYQSSPKATSPSPRPLLLSMGTHRNVCYTVRGGECQGSLPLAV